MPVTVEGEFTDFEDMWLWLIHMEKKWVVAKDRASRAEVMDKLSIFRSELSNLSNMALSNMGADPSGWINSDQSLEIWRSFIEALSGEQGQNSREMVETDNPWGVWRDYGSDSFPGVGLNDNTTTELSPRLASTKHTYDHAIPEIDDWNLHSAQQGDYTFYVGVAKAKEIDAVSSVPSIEPFDEADEGARWILNADTLTETWQRKLDKNRVISISTFAETSASNSIVNSIILFIPPNQQGVSMDRETGQLSFDFSEFLVGTEVNGYTQYRDFTLNHEGDRDTDHRPLWILDGQHRTRGLALSKRGSNLMLPVIVLQGGDNPEDFSLADAAKLFTEINTLNKTLNKEMQYMLGQRFNINGSNYDNDWGAYEDPAVKNNVRVRRRANHLGYKFALRLCSEEDSPLRGAVQFFGGRASSKIRYMIGVWMKEARKWFKSGIYSADSGLGEEEIYNEIRNYYAAIDRCFNHNTRARAWDRQPRVTRWNPTRGHNTSLVENKIQSKNLMILLTDIVSKYLADTDEPVRPIPTSGFEELLKPLRNVDWLDRNLKSIYTGGGEQRRSAMLAWMIDAVLHADRQNLPAISDVTSDDVNLANKAGFAVMSAPGNTEIDRVESYPPTADAPMTIFLNGPRNCWRDLKELSRLEITLNRPNNEPFMMDLMMSGNAELEGHRTEHNDLKVKIELKNQNILRIIGSTSMKLTGSWSNEVSQSNFSLDYDLVDRNA